MPLNLYCMCLHVCFPKKQGCEFIAAAMEQYGVCLLVPISTCSCEPAPWTVLLVNETTEDKAAFMDYACSRLYTYSLRGSFCLCISYRGILAHLIPPGMYLSMQKARRKGACVDSQSTFDQERKLRLPICWIFLVEIPFQEGQWGNAWLNTSYYARDVEFYDQRDNHTEAQLMITDVAFMAALQCAHRCILDKVLQINVTVYVQI